MLDVLDLEGKLDALTKMTTSAEPLHWPNVDEVRTDIFSLYDALCLEEGEGDRGEFIYTLCEGKANQAGSDAVGGEGPD